ncbi:MAG: ribbon-helix-helix domain-containing protein [Patescibacteria group bacterium]
MREVINISLPATMAKTVKMAVKRGEYASTSEFFRSLLRRWQEEFLLEELEESRLEIKNGKGKKLRSLKDLR